MIENIDRRVLGAIEFVDAITAARVTDSLQVDAEGVSMAPNRSGLFVIHHAPGFDAYVASFAAPPVAPPAPLPVFTATVRDAGRRYQARAFDVTLPRATTGIDDADSVLRPLKVALSSSGARPVAASWAVLRARVVVQGDAGRTGLANVLLTLTPSLPGFAAQTVLTDARGEALIAVAGAPALAAGSGDGDVLTADFDATLQLVVDPDAARAATPLVADATPTGQPIDVPIADPQRIATRGAAPTPGVRVIAGPTVTLTAGASRSVVVEVSWP